MPPLLIGTSAFANANTSLLKEAGMDWIRADFPLPFVDRLGGSLSDEYLQAREHAHAWAAKGFQVMGVSPLPGIGTYQPDASGALQLTWTSWLPAWMGDVNTGALSRRYREVCAFLADDLKDCVRGWQIANELNHIQFSGPLKPFWACDLLIEGGTGLKETDPSLFVGWNSCLPILAYYFYGRLHADPRRIFDYVGIDAYYGTWDPGAPEDWGAKIMELSELTHTKVMVNEWGYASEGAVMTSEELRAHSGPNCALKKWRYSWSGAHTPAVQAEFVRRALAEMDRYKHLLTGIFFYRWEDQAVCWQCGQPDCPVETRWGLVDEDNRPKPSFEAWKEGIRSLKA
jgi:hypothetical protein